MAVCDVRFYNIIILGLSFMFIFTAFQTCSMIEASTLIVWTIATNLGIIYAVFSASNWAAPSFVNFAGAKLSMLLGASLYFLFILSFLKPMTWALYLGSVLVGFGAAILWTGQGNFLTVNSDSETISRNSGIFWALLQCSLLFGNMYSYFVFKGSSEISADQRTNLFLGLCGAAVLGLLCLLLLRKKIPSNRRFEGSTDNEASVNLNSSEASTSSQSSPSALEGLKTAFRLAKTREMILLSFTFAYTGLELTFFSGVYGACISHNLHYGANRNGLVGLSGMFIGVGAILGGGIFGIFGKKTNKYGRDPVVIMGYLSHMIAFYLIYINIPENSPLVDTELPTFIESNDKLALFCSFLLGFADSCFNTQLYSILGFMYPDDSSAAFALFKFVQSVSTAIGFYYSLALHLEWQLLILVITGTIGTLTFNIIEWENNAGTREGYQTI
ncbi:hypothetical protein LOTGIDRAFT_154229 [Lottia gigantea]|uniref:UNC93-like protein MFSD11 n=1 Tax=Lottia gigantea TaxID=225164 RepID=V4BKN3_LOTGI|nr:hypothetical protein LOTGIDRAFT_154229 [Lottia gigantea]ESO89144.1 hypothetical protein LOTGIDRAFT_154229 [Lottia gigantea]